MPPSFIYRSKDILDGGYTKAVPVIVSFTRQNTWAFDPFLEYPECVPTYTLSVDECYWLVRLAVNIIMELMVSIVRLTSDARLRVWGCEGGDSFNEEIILSIISFAMIIASFGQVEMMFL